MNWIEPGLAIVPFAPAHALAIELQPGQWVEGGFDARHCDAGQADRLMAGDPWTAIDGDDRVLACGGVLPGEAPFQDHGLAWAMIARDVPMRAMVWISAWAAKLIAEAPMRRVEAMIADDPRCLTWARRVGLTHEGRMTGWGPAGVTVHVHARVR